MTRPEPVATADLAAQARAVARDAESRRPGGSAIARISLLDALADAAAERDELRIALAQEVAKGQFERGATDALAAERDRAHATLRKIEKHPHPHADFVKRLARDRLANP